MKESNRITGAALFAGADLRKWQRAALLTLFVCFLMITLFALPASAEVTGFVCAGDDGQLYSYSYEALLDSYAMKLLGVSDGLFDDFIGKPIFAVKNSANAYIDYADILDRYAMAVVSGRTFNIHSYAVSRQAQKANMPDAVVSVSLAAGRVVREELKLKPDAGSAAVAVDTGAKPVKPEPPIGGSDENEGNEPLKPVTVTPLTGAPEVSLAQAQAWARSKGAQQRYIDIAPLYWEYGLKSGLRPEVLYAQAALETGFGRFNGQVPAGYNNWAGIKVSTSNGDEPEDHQQFDTPEDGVRAHFNHMSAYVGLTPIGKPHDRYYVVARISWAGTVGTVEELSGKWAPSATYHERIVTLLVEMK